MDRSYCLVNSNRLRIKRFIENTNNKDQFLNIFLLILEKSLLQRGKEPPVMTIRKELKKEPAREEWKTNCSGWEKNRGRLDKKRKLRLLILTG